MSHSPLLFNPSRASFEELDATLIARRPLIDQLERDLISDSKRKTRRHWQLIGPRGSGKSHITELLSRRLHRDHGWAVARLPEEHYQVSSVGELLEQIVIRVENLRESPLGAVKDPVDLEDVALDRLRKFRTASGKPILVILENLGLLFDRKLRERRDQSRLREILMHNPIFALVCTATSYVDATVQHSAPFYDFFQVIDLEDLKSDEVAELIEARARWDMDEFLLTHVDTVRARIQAVFHFSGGNPRLILALYSILRGGFTEELHMQLLRLLDEVTPYYQSRLTDVSPQMGRIVVEMALAASPLTPSDIARRCRMPINHVTANVAKLAAERFIRPTGRPDLRRRFYDLNDRLFRLWIQMREDPSTRQRLRFLSEFFQRWYQDHPEEVRDAASKVAEAFWTDLRDDATQRCQEHVATLEYLQDALPTHAGTLVTRSLAEQRPAANRDEAQDQIRRLRPLSFSDSPLVRGVVGILISAAYQYLGDRNAALKALLDVDSSEVPERVRHVLWSSILNINAELVGPDRAIEIGLKTARSGDEMKNLLNPLSLLAIDGGNFSQGVSLLQEYLEGALCNHCKAGSVREFVARLIDVGRFKEIGGVLPLLKSVTDINKKESKALKTLSSLEPRPSKPDRVLSAIQCWDDIQDVPSWLLWHATCAISHSREHAARAFPLIQEVARREREIDPHSIYHVLLGLLNIIEERGDAKSMCEWIIQTIPSSKLQSVFVEWMPYLARTQPNGAILIIALYKLLRDADILSRDLLPYSAAVDVVDAVIDLNSLSPEVKEAVGLLLNVDPKLTREATEHKRRKIKKEILG